jgi:hypothetical protein
MAYLSKALVLNPNFWATGSLSSNRNLLSNSIKLIIEPSFKRPSFSVTNKIPFWLPIVLMIVLRFSKALSLSGRNNKWQDDRSLSG